jgi:hypothetical protein
MLELAFDALILVAIYLGLPTNSKTARAVLAAAAVVFVVLLVLFLIGRRA